MVKYDGDKQHLQNGLHKLVKLSEKWQMLLHFFKCKCLNVNNKMKHTVLGTTIKEKVLGVTVSADIKVCVVLLIQRVIKF